MADLLKTLKDKLKSYNPTLQTVEQTGSVPRLSLKLDNATLVLSLASDAQRATGENPNPREPDYLQMFAGLNFTPKQESLVETALLLTYINARLPLMGFIITINLDQIALKYTHLVDPQKPQIDLIQEAVETIAFQLDTFAAPIQQVATGQRGYQEVAASLNI